MGWVPPPATDSDVDDWITSAWGTAITDALRWLLATSSTWNTSGIATGTGLAASGRVGLLSGTDWDNFNAKGNAQIVAASYTGNGADSRTIATLPAGTARLLVVANTTDGILTVSIGTNYHSISSGAGVAQGNVGATTVNFSGAAVLGGSAVGNINGRNYIVVAAGY